MPQGVSQSGSSTVWVGGRAGALDQRDGTSLAFVGLELRAVEQVPGEHALHHMQHGVTRSG
jgi:hypothetical protein